jgi:hypothetical protein
MAIPLLITIGKTSGNLRKPPETSGKYSETSGKSSDNSEDSGKLRKFNCISAAH